MDRIQLGLLQKKMKQTLKNSKVIFTICDELSNAYYNEFGVMTKTIFTGTNYTIAEYPSKKEKITGITYLGNLSCNRYMPIAEIGKVLDTINERKKTDFGLYIYSTPLKKEIESVFEKIKSIKYCGYVTGEKFREIIRDADVLLHVEAFEKQFVDRVKHSISTKIADCLGSGNLLLAYGPEKVASIQHLIKNKCAVVVTKSDDLEKVLEEIFDGEVDSSIVGRSLMTAREHHTSEKNSLLLREILSGEMSKITE